MDANLDIKSCRERWKAIEEIERIGLTKYNLLARLMIGLGIKSDDDVDRMQIILRWAKLKELYEQGRVKSMD